MKFLLFVLLGCVGGFIIGITLSELIGVFGVVLFNKAIGIKYLPIYTAVICGVVVPIISQKTKLKRSK